METNQTPSMDELWSMVRQQQAEVAELKAQLAQQRVEKLALSSRVLEMEDARGSRRVSRGGLLKAAAVGVAGLAGAGGLRTQPAAAAGTDGDVGMGVTNTTGTNSSANAETIILAAGGMSGSAVFRADAYNGGANTGNIDGLQGQGSGTYSGVAGFGGPGGGEGIFGAGGGTYGSGVVGVASGATNPGANLAAGVYGVATSGDGVHGSSTYGAGVSATSTSGDAIDATSTSGTGVYARSNSANGVDAISSSGIGIYASSGSYIDVYAGGTGRIRLYPQGAAGGPTTGAHFKGEQIVDNLGVPYVCTADGTPGTWQAIGNLRSFSGPHRVFGDGTVISYGTTTAAIDATAGSGVPAGAKSAYCAVQATGQGVLTLFPDGATDPGIANWANTGASGQLALFYMLVPLSAAGKFKIHAYLTGQIYVDVWGYLL